MEIDMFEKHAELELELKYSKHSKLKSNWLHILVIALLRLKYFSE